MVEQVRRYMIAIPCMEMMHTAFVSSLVNMRRVGANKVTFLSNSLIYDARNMLAAEALDTGADRILWLDSDMVFEKTGELLAYTERNRSAFCTEHILIRKHEILNRKCAVKSEMRRFKIVENAELILQN